MNTLKEYTRSKTFKSLTRSTGEQLKSAAGVQPSANVTRNNTRNVRRTQMANLNAPEC